MDASIADMAASVDAVWNGGEIWCGQSPISRQARRHGVQPSGYSRHLRTSELADAAGRRKFRAAFCQVAQVIHRVVQLVGDIPVNHVVADVVNQASRVRNAQSPAPEIPCFEEVVVPRPSAVPRKAYDHMPVLVAAVLLFTGPEQEGIQSQAEQVGLPCVGEVAQGGVVGLPFAFDGKAEHQLHHEDAAVAFQGFGEGCIQAVKDFGLYGSCRSRVNRHFSVDG